MVGDLSFLKILLIIAFLFWSGVEAKTQSVDGVVVGATFEGEIDTQGKTVNIVVEYQVDVKGNKAIPIKGLLFNNDRLELSSVSFNDQRIAVDLLTTNGLLSGALNIRDHLTGEEGVVRLSYQIAIEDDRKEIDLTIPVLYVNWPAVGSKEDLFQADLTLPTSFKIVETFPSTNWIEEEENKFQTSVPAIPSMLRINAVLKSDSQFSFSSIVDLAVGLVLVVLMFLGWRKLKMTM